MYCVYIKRIFGKLDEAYNGTFRQFVKQKFKASQQLKKGGALLRKR
jgi:hypothetical protein